jgi:VIT1/CCC1 family predicted Fe2+/Mn2+ transporter
MNQKLRAAILGSNDGLVSISSLLMGVVAAHKGNLALVGLAGIVAGSMSMAVGEYVSVRAEGSFKDSYGAALASSLSFAAGGLIPFVGIYLSHKMWSIGVLTILGLILSGVASAHEVDNNKRGHIIRVIFGGVLGMAITSGIGYLVR